MTDIQRGLRPVLPTFLTRWLGWGWSGALLGSVVVALRRVVGEEVAVAGGLVAHWFYGSVVSEVGAVVPDEPHGIVGSGVVLVVVGGVVEAEGF